MNKEKFLDQAFAKYKKACKSKWVSEMNFIFSPDLILRVWFDTNVNPKNKEGDTGYRHKWCSVETLSTQADKDILYRLGEAICNDEVGEDEAIVAFLRRIKNDKTWNKQANGHKFTHQGKQIEITMWEPLDHFTLQMLAEHIGVA